MWPNSACLTAYPNGCCVPKDANNCTTINDSFGAVSAVSETQDDFRFVPFLAYLFSVSNDRYLETVVLVQSDSRWLVHPWLRVYH